MLILKQFQLTPRKCLSNFKNVLRHPSEFHVQFASRLTATFDYYCRLREVGDFKELCDLMVSDKLYETLDFKTREHIGIWEGQTWFKPNELGRECDLFYSSRGKSLVEVSNSRMERFKNKKPSISKNHIRKAQGNPKEPMRNPVYLNSNKSKRSCYVCGARGKHFYYSRECPRRVDKGENPKDHQRKVVSGIKIKSDNTSRNELEYIDLVVDGRKIKSLKDTGAS